MFKQKINLDRHSPEPYPNIWHFPDPPIFSLPTTFNVILFVWIMFLEKMTLPFLMNKSQSQKGLYYYSLKNA